MHIAAGTGLFLLITILVIFPLADRFCASRNCWIWFFFSNLAIFIALYATLFYLEQ